MCGFAGLAWRGEGPPQVEHTVSGMVETLLHRGPDSEGRISCGFAEVGFRRLSIIDLAHGQQPAANEDKTIEVFLNGEIYNHRELRAELEVHGHQFRSNSDTEIIPHLYEEYGAEFVGKLNGMFAICIVDHEKKKTLIFRDRLGIKPLYYGTRNGVTVFASELKAIIASDLVEPVLDKAQVAQFLNYFYCPGTATLLEGIRKLEPGGVLEIGADGGVATSRFYKIPVSPVAEQKGADLEMLDELLLDSIEKRLVADVPVGVSLSGGIDSSLITTYAARSHDADFMAFTVVFEETPPEEMACAVELARKLEIEHVKLEASSDDLWSEAPQLVWFSDEPIADPAYLGAQRVAEAAAQHVKVMLAGTGADELFAGYGRYSLSKRNRLCSALPSSVLRSGGARKTLERWYSGEELEALSAYEGSRQHWHQLQMSNLSARERTELAEALGASPLGPDALAQSFADSSMTDSANQQMYCDSVTYLEGQLLPLLDRTTMSKSIEGRVPFLDHRLVEQAFMINGNEKMNGSQRDPKAILKQLARKAGVPESVLTRRKLGFPNAVENWFGGALAEPLRDLLLSPKTYSGRNLRAWVEPRVASPAAIRKNWKSLYALFVLNIWYEVLLEKRISTPPKFSIDDLFEMRLTPQR